MKTPFAPSQAGESGKCPPRIHRSPSRSRTPCRAARPARAARIPLALAGAAFFAASAAAPGQGERPAIVGPLAGEVPAASAGVLGGRAAAPAAEPDFEVLESHAQRWNGRNVVFQRVKPPRDAATTPKPARESARPGAAGAAAARIAAASARRPRLETVDLTVAATVVDRRATLLSWSWKGEACEMWIRQDWLLLSGFGGLRRGDKLFSTLLLPSAVDLAILPADSPLRIPAALPPEPGAFLVVKGDPADAEAFETVAALRDIYRNELPRLRRAFAAREEARRRREAAAAARRAHPEDIVFRYWRRPSETLRPAVVRPAPPRRAAAPRSRRAAAAESRRKGTAR